MQKSESVMKIAEAMSKAQSAFKTAEKTTTNPFFHSKYADLESVIKSCKEPLSLNGLSYIQCPENEGEIICVETIIFHSSGEWISSRIGLKPVKSDPQTIGSLISYLKRYSLSAMLGIATGEAEDDANEASSGHEMPKKTVSEGILDHLKDQVKDKPVPENKPPSEGQPAVSEFISEKQVSMLHARATEYKISKEGLTLILKDMGFESAKFITKKRFDEVLKLIAALK